MPSDTQVIFSMMRVLRQIYLACGPFASGIQRFLARDEILSIDFAEANPWVILSL